MRAPSQTRREPRFLLRLNPISACLAALSAAVPAVALAQAAADPQQVTVTGIRRGIESAISVKKNASSIVEAVSSEDIGKLPDNSIAESIARLPGLAAQRVGGRAQGINIRGLSGDFAGTLLNGREQVSTGDNRAIEFDQYPSELLSGVVVYKTPDASLFGQGLSGTLNMQTVRPLDMGGRVVSLGARYERNSLGAVNPDGSPNGYRFNATYIDQFADRSVGVAIGFAHLDAKSQSHKWNAWGYPQNNAGTLRTLGGTEARNYSGVGKRDSLMAVVEWRPTKAFRTSLDLYLSRFDEKVIDRGTKTGLAWSGASLSTATSADGFVTDATWVGVHPVLWGEEQKRTDDIGSVGWNGKWQGADGWRFEGDVSYAKAKRKESILEMYAGTAQSLTDIFSYSNGKDGVPQAKMNLNYADTGIVRLLDSGGWGQGGYVKYMDVADQLGALKLVGGKDFEWSIFSGVDFGFNHADRKKTKEMPESLLCLKSGTPGNCSSGATDIPAALNLGSVDLSGTGQQTNVVAWNIGAAADQLYNFLPKQHPDIYNKQWEVREKVTSAFVKANIDTTLAGMELRGNVGLQLAQTNQRSTALAVDQNNCVSGTGNIQVCPTSTINDGKSYTDVLPSLNLALGLSVDQTLRLGIARQVAHPRLDQLRSTMRYSWDATKMRWGGDGGNPQLNPYRADAVDLSWEKYFGTKAYIGVAGFYKNLRTYIRPGTTYKDFGGYAMPNGAITPAGTLGALTSPVNGEGGKIQGVELSLSMPLAQLTPALDGFGIIASYAYTDSKIDTDGNGTPLPGLSRDVYNFAAYYEKYGFSARIAYRFRSEFLGEIQGFGADRDYERIGSEGITDLQFGYDFSSGAAKGLTLLFQVNNATNTPYRSFYPYNNEPNRAKEVNRYGRTFLLGVNYKM